LSLVVVLAVEAVNSQEPAVAAAVLVDLELAQV
jgi:hypothetical protein